MSINRKSSITDLRGPFDGFPFSRSLLSLLDPSVSFSFQPNTSGFGLGHIDWKETPEAHVFKVDLPGIKKEEVKVEVDERNILQISGKRIGEDEDKNDTWHLLERSSGKFLRRFRLPENANMDQIKAAMGNGVLTVTVPKKEEVKNKKSEITSIEIEGGKGGGSGCLKMPCWFRSKKPQKTAC
ncbi:18.2 kDa class I heat shock protein [Rhynchospora pubera]|uniref:18.2 kDa class I heat shock protein n=1 Tax=Rhynchospora pubera TaxID=906938 RepID=A0AAV8G1Z9_9POAL|nr:18.2 kDa class I heat shock protein [Rhynchospora pubera]